MAGQLVVVHVSDIHINGKGHSALTRFRKICDRIIENSQAAEQIVFVLSGDLAYSGTSEEYEPLRLELEAVATEIQAKTSAKFAWLIVPGNHDGNFKDSSKSRKHAIQGVLADGELGVDDSVIQTCVAPQQDYFQFEGQLIATESYSFKDSLLGIRDFEVSGKKVSFWGLNASWMSQIPEQQGKLVFPVSRYEHIAKDTVDLRIGVIHHPLNWYAQDSYHPLRDFIYKNFCLLLSGHEHVAKGHAIENIDGSGKTLALESAAFAPHHDAVKSEFSILDIDVQQNELVQRHFEWSKRSDGFIPNPEKTRSIKLTLVTQRLFQPTDNLRDRLEDLGAPFLHPTKALRLSDVFIEPLFRELDLNDQGTNGSPWAKVVPDIASVGRKLIRGDDHYGKTSFLHKIFLRALDANLVPILLTAKDLISGTDDQKNRRVEEAVELQFGSHCLNAFRALPSEKKLLLIDDLDHLGTKEDLYLRVLNFSKNLFPNAIATISERFDVSVLGSTKVAAQLAEFDELRMLGFSYAMRTELIRRWYTLDRGLDAKGLEEKIHSAQDQIDAAVGKAIVPSTAFNTLMILQALEATQKSQVVDASIAQHYDLLMRRRLLDSGVAAKKIDGVYTYLSHLAWWMKKAEVTMLDRTELSQFNTHYSQAVHPTELTARLELLVQARILQLSDGAFRFRYPSSKYFFLAHYISEHLEEDSSLKALVQTACRHLYLKDNANLIVFLTSKTASKWIVREVTSVLSDLLKGNSFFNVLTDAKVVNGWVSQTARLVIEDSDNTEENRKKQRDRDEEAQRREDSNIVEKEVSSVSELDAFTQINLVFKTSEILGLILKTRVESLSTDLKDEIVKALFEGPLRAISYFLAIVNDQPDAMVEMLSKIWEEKLPKLSGEQRQNLAKKLIYFSLGAYSQALLLRQGEIAGSPDLSHYVQRLVETTATQESAQEIDRGTTLTYRLVAVATRLSYPGDIPFTEVEKLAKDLKHNHFGFSLLQGLVGNHLYMFPVQFSTRQKLAAVVGIDLKKQIARNMIQQDKKIEERVFQRRHPKGLIQRLLDSYLGRNPRVKEISEKSKHVDGGATQD